jgi:diguanylate cyclase (GGDEF)-like protein
MQDKIRELAFYDSLTKLANRRLLYDRLSQTISSSKRSQKYAAIIYLDLDNFKALNDTYGHAVGNLLLIEVANRLKGCVREVDTVARVGGDEFAVIIYALDEEKEKSMQEITKIAQKILDALSVVYFFNIANDKNSRVEHYCSASIGVSIFKADDESEETLLQHADTAMYKAKEAGRNRIRFYLE